MNKKFCKGQKVVMLGIWDRQGSVYVRHLTVGSAGDKQMHLLKADGTLGCRISADGINQKTFDRNTNEYFATAFVIDASEYNVEMAMAFAERVLSAERAQLEHCLKQNAGEAYDASIRKSLSELHEARVVEYPEG